MFTLINYVKRVIKPVEPGNYGDQYLVWGRALASSSGRYVGGDAPGIRDFLLFSVVQCHSSIPTPPVEALQHDERLSMTRQWIANVHNRFGDCPHLYSGRPHSARHFSLRTCYDVSSVSSNTTVGLYADA